MSIPAESSGIPTPAGKELAAVTVVAMAEAMVVAVMAVAMVVRHSPRQHSSAPREAS